MVNSKTIEKKISNLLFENSTIYLDNINEISISFQAHLLNFLEILSQKLKMRILKM